MIILPFIYQLDPSSPTRYSEHVFSIYHRVDIHHTQSCMALRHKVQYFIDSNMMHV